MLITLGIIGIVASMTLPSLINKIQDRQYKTAYKKAYSGFSQAFLRMQNESEFIGMNEGASTFPCVDINGNSITCYRYPAVGDNFKIISKYFKSLKTCFENNADKCWECDKGESGKYYSSAPLWQGCTIDSYAFIDNSGMAWYLYSNAEWPILVDVNGNKKPNKLGQDRFVMRFANGGEGTYVDSADRIIPWHDQTAKGRWCPSGNCMYKTWILE